MSRHFLLHLIFQFTKSKKRVQKYLVDHINTYRIPALLVSHGEEEQMLADSIFAIWGFQVIKRCRGGKGFARGYSNCGHHLA